MYFIYAALFPARWPPVVCSLIRKLRGGKENVASGGNRNPACFLSLLSITSTIDTVWRKCAVEDMVLARVFQEQIVIPCEVMFLWFRSACGVSWPRAAPDYITSLFSVFRMLVARIIATCAESLVAWLCGHARSTCLSVSEMECCSALFRRQWTSV